MNKFELNDVEQKLIRQVAAILSLDAAKISPEAPLHTLGVDSLSFVELLVFIEQEFKIKLMESGMTREDFRTIRALAKRISKPR